MKNWKESRNYRRIKDGHGKVIANIITVDGIDVEVSEEVFLAYSQADRRERYMTEDTPEGRVLSLDQMDEDEVQQDYVGGETVPSVEEQLLERQTAQERESMKQDLLLALLSLSDTDRELITALFFDGVSAREYARMTGVSDMAVRKRRDRVLRNLKKFFSK
jgi:RNA polymerase sigma factor (sigma-70 family)